MHIIWIKFLYFNLSTIFQYSKIQDYLRSKGSSSFQIFRMVSVFPGKTAAQINFSRGNCALEYQFINLVILKCLFSLKFLTNIDRKPLFLTSEPPAFPKLESLETPGKTDTAILICFNGKAWFRNASRGRQEKRKAFPLNENYGWKCVIRVKSADIQRKIPSLLLLVINLFFENYNQ